MQTLFLILRYHNGKLIVPDSRIKIQSVGGSPNTGFSHALLIQDTCLEGISNKFVCLNTIFTPYKTLANMSQLQRMLMGVHQALLF